MIYYTIGTVLANEEVINGLSERGNYPVIRQPLRQWALKISAYGDKLEKELADLNWPKGTLAEQHTWIGQSEGALIKFPLEGKTDNSATITVFTTRPETISGVTFLALAPEHPLVAELTTPENRKKVSDFLESVMKKKDLERISSVNSLSEASGVFLGSYAINPITLERIPLYIMEFILADDKGTEAIMGVPCHDKLAHTLSSLFHIPKKQIIIPPSTTMRDKDPEEESCSYFNVEEGVMVNSGEAFNGLSLQECRQTVIKLLEDKNWGKAYTSYFRNREWNFSRQRYWGEPIPIYYPVEILSANPDTGSRSPLEDAPHRILYDQPIAVDESDLPLLLPELTDFHPHGDPHGCLVRAKEWRYFQKEKDGKWYARETNTMPQWAGSCWYYLRFTDPKNSSAMLSKESHDHWLPVDLYIGGQEHAVLHLLYARFWHKFLYDLDVVSHAEPFQQLLHQGMVLGPDGEKMSKSRGNVISIDDAVEEYGADILRMYETFACPLEHKNKWSTTDIIGIIRFRNRFYYLLKKGILLDDLLEKPYDLKSDQEKEMEYLVHFTVYKVTHHIEKLSFPVIMELLNNLMNFFYNPAKNQTIGEGSDGATGPEDSKSRQLVVPKSVYEIMIKLISPFAPHFAEECWSMIGNAQESLSVQPWPSYSEEVIRQYEKEKNQVLTLNISVNGQKKFSLQFPKGLSQEEIIQRATNHPDLQTEVIQRKQQFTKVLFLDKIQVINFVFPKEKKADKHRENQF
jgi:leucyl-tRNA synthetase